jgi:hypothetical protein
MADNLALIGIRKIRVFDAPIFDFRVIRQCAASYVTGILFWYVRTYIFFYVERAHTCVLIHADAF